MEQQLEQLAGDLGQLDTVQSALDQLTGASEPGLPALDLNTTNLEQLTVNDLNQLDMPSNGFPGLAGADNPFDLPSTSHTGQPPIPMPEPNFSGINILDNPPPGRNRHKHSNDACKADPSGERKRRASADQDKFTMSKKGGFQNATVATLLLEPSDSNANMVYPKLELSRNGKGILDNPANSDLTGKERTGDGLFQRPRSRTDDLTWVSNKREEPGRGRAKEDISKAKSTEASSVFRNPSTMPTSPMHAKKKHRPEPLIIPPHVNHFGFQSRLRSPRLWDTPKPHGNTPPPYTPPPMLSPVRSGAGLFWPLTAGARPFTPKSAPLTPRLFVRRTSE